MLSSKVLFDIKMNVDTDTQWAYCEMKVQIKIALPSILGRGTSPNSLLYRTSFLRGIYFRVRNHALTVIGFSLIDVTKGLASTIAILGSTRHRGVHHC